VNTFLRHLREYRPLRSLCLAVLLCTLLAPPIALAMPLVQKQLIDGVVLAHRVDLLVPTMALYSGLWLLSAAVMSGGTVLQAYLSERVTLRLRQQLFAHCEALSLAFSHQEHSGRTMSLFVNDVPNVAGLLGTTLSIFGSILVLLISGGLMFRLSWRFALVVAIVPPVVAALAAVVTRPLRPMTRRAQEKAAELTERLQENLAGIREVVAFGQRQPQSLRFTTTMGELLRLRMRVIFVDTGMRAGQSLFSLALTLVILGYGGYLVIHGRATLGSLFAFQGLFGYLYQALGGVFGFVVGVQKATASAERVYAFLDQTPRVQERPGSRSLRRVTGAITFDRVSFGYDPQRPVLHEVSLTTDPGQMIALVGPSGAGKSTLASLVVRFYDPTSGRVLLDGADLRDLRLDDLRSQMGMVFQNTFLFATTIRENIAFGREGAGEPEIISAARAANAWEFIEALPHGLDTQVGERGVQLSEGQKQRLAIARAFLRNPSILILDEPTAALDARSENLFQSALDNLMRGRTTFVIAHRLATILRADRIVVLEGGRIVEQGTHSELMQHRGLYCELFELQFCGAPLSTDRALRAPVAAPAG
jgi:ATP-binding cassette, subfamily B, bacterial MsbA